jgi:hypothetical protein
MSKLSLRPDASLDSVEICWRASRDHALHLYGLQFAIRSGRATLLPPTRQFVTTPDNTSAVMAQLLSSHGLTPDTRLYREALFSALKPADVAGTFRLSANAAPSESVIDVYGAGYVILAESAGAGLAFAETPRPNWQETMELRTLRLGANTEGTLPDPHVEVEARLGDLLAQGAKVYPVESVTVEKAWYCTMPAGEVVVRVVP